MPNAHLTHASLYCLFIVILSVLSAFADANEMEASSDSTHTALMNNGDPKKGKMALDDLRAFVKAFNHIRSAYVEEVDDATCRVPSGSTGRLFENFAYMLCHASWGSCSQEFVSVQSAITYL